MKRVKQQKFLLFHLFNLYSECNSTTYRKKKVVPGWKNKQYSIEWNVFMQNKMTQFNKQIISYFKVKLWNSYRSFKTSLC